MAPARSSVVPAMARRLAAVLIGVALARDAGVAAHRPALAAFAPPSLARLQPAPARPVPPPRESLGRLRARHQLEIERIVDRAIAQGEMPGAVVIIGRKDGVLFRRAFGRAAVEPAPRALRANTVFDLASVTKAVVTATSVAWLVDHGRLRYDDPVSRFLPAFALPDKRAITVRQLLTHTSGLPADNMVAEESAGLGSSIASIARTPLGAAPGERYLYSDLGFIVLGGLVARVSAQPLDRFAERALLSPLGLEDTRFRPGPALALRAAPTARVDGRFLQGVVHDPRARALGGVAGHAGLFSTADDLARFSRMLLGKGELDGARVLSPVAVRTMTAPVVIGEARVALGWDSPDDPERAAFSASSFGHEGFTGTSLWIDPERDLFVVFLSSRLHPDGKGRVGPVAQAIRAVAARAASDLDSTLPRVALGIDVLAADGFHALAGKRVLLLTHDAARDREGRRTLDVLYSAPNVKLVALAAPEHGLGVDRDGNVDDARDARTGLEVVSTYGARTRLPEDRLRNVDALVVDLVDVGARFFTYEGSLLDALRAAARAHRAVFVLDRPNPNGAERVEGPLSDPDVQSRINPFPLPVVHGMTLGELAKLFDSELALGTELSVIPVQGYAHRDRFADTGLEWFAPSPNLRTPNEAVLYPGVALIEATNVSVGRGTGTPFELVGAPFIDGSALARRLGERPLPGVRVTPVSFVPAADPHRGELCHGVRFELEDARSFRPVLLGLRLAETLRTMYPSEWHGDGLGLLLGNREQSAGLLAGRSAAELLDASAVAIASFRRRRAAALLYP
jgi:uncharacterized protein YbbC (DUF1343 family)